MTRKLSTEFKREFADLVIVHGYKHKDAADAMVIPPKNQCMNK